jgi:hypothetical protein
VNTSPVTKYVSATACAALVFLASGCATIIGKAGQETVDIKSTPDQAVIVITDESGAKVFEGTTPAQVALDKKRGYMKGKSYTVTLRKPGFEPQTIPVETQVSGWYIAGNLVFGGVIGWLAVDPNTGAMWTLATNKINATLAPAKAAGGHERLRVVMLDEVPAELRAKLRPVTQQ